MTDSAHILTVSRLVSLLKETVEDNFIQIAVEGEVSNLAQPASGHLYFTLKDDGAQIRAVMFRHTARLLKFSQENGLQVVCRGRVSLYPQRGELQLVVEAMEPVGAGSLQLAFEQLKQKLTDEGLFAAARKRALPAYPQTVGIVTSATGAAIHDILQVLDRRGSGLTVLLWPVRVQGDEAAAEIAAGISGLNQHGEADVIICGRGGGSLEDLWAFNEEIVARAIATSKIPIISAVGHEVDFTIADFVADLRAATPTAAAEQLTRGKLELESHLDQLRLRLVSQMSGRLELWQERIAGLRRRLISPEQQFKMWCHRLDDLTSRLHRSIGQCRQQHMAQIDSLAARLDTLSPLKTLDRGYSIARRSDGSAVLDSKQIDKGELLQLTFSRGGARVRVEELDQ